MERDSKSLLDMLDSAQLAIEYVGNYDLQTFTNDTRVQDAVIRRLEVIGEAAKRISSARRKEWQHLPWSQMIGLRNIVIQEYDNVDIEALWNTVIKDLPNLITEIALLLPKE